MHYLDKNKQKEYYLKHKKKILNSAKKRYLAEQLLEFLDWSELLKQSTVA